jgi:GT2 family glycosyltransferase
MNKTAVVILNYNGQKYLTDFLPSVINHSQNADVYVADNASTDDSIVILKRDFPSVKIIQLFENHGFAQGYNEALEHLKDQFHCRLPTQNKVLPRKNPF